MYEDYAYFCSDANYSYYVKDEARLITFYFINEAKKRFKED